MYSVPVSGLCSCRDHMHVHKENERGQGGGGGSEREEREGGGERGGGGGRFCKTTLVYPKKKFYKKLRAIHMSTIISKFLFFMCCTFCHWKFVTIMAWGPANLFVGCCLRSKQHTEYISRVNLNFVLVLPHWDKWGGGGWGVIWQGWTFSHHSLTCYPITTGVYTADKSQPTAKKLKCKKKKKKKKNLKLTIFMVLVITTSHNTVSSI